jgi:hypothetical protein
MRFPYSAFDVAADGQHIVAFQFEGGKSGFAPSQPSSSIG